MLAGTTFFDFFNFPLVKGNWEQALAAKNYAVISESFANKYWNYRKMPVLTNKGIGRKCRWPVSLKISS